ncbi:unnamed protein product [Rotaria sp. Silwood2]|nr:unnamed protein product [Rotaria sp. Silwood2]CAF4245696.1 unnamed protein product [Rotaria sp. Silwood2]
MRSSSRTHPWSTTASSVPSTATTAYGYGICSCSCCFGEECVPTYEGSVEIPSCDGQFCMMTCQRRFPWTCGSSGSHEIDAKCTRVTPTTTTSTKPTTISPTTRTYDICSCSCCNGEECVPSYEGIVEVPSCAGQYCVMACQQRFPWTCGSSGPHEVDAKCREITSTTPTTTPFTTTSSVLTTTTSTYALCSCFCCTGDGCDPVNQGTIQVPSCDGQYCAVACQNRFPWTCGSSGPHEIDAKCSRNTLTTITNTKPPTTSVMTDTTSTARSNIRTTQ